MGRTHRANGARHARIVSFAAAAALAVGLVGCSSGSVGDSSVPAADAGIVDSDAQAGAELAAGAETAVVDQAIITTGDARVQVDAPADSARAFSELVTGFGGHIESQQTTATGDFPTAYVTARVPADRYQELVDSLADMGTVLETSSSSSDVGQQVVDLEARIGALQSSIDRLNELIAQATTTADLLQAEDMLTARQAELDSLQSQLLYLQDQVDLSTLTVTFTTRESDGTTGPSFSWGQAWEQFLATLFGIAYFVIAVLPIVVLVGIVVAIYLLWRRRRRLPAPSVGHAAPAGDEPQARVDAAASNGETTSDT